jgi:hypothetical protein
MPWRRRMLAVLRELKLEPFITGDRKERPVISSTSPVVTQDDINTWAESESKARIRLELAISDSEMVHIIGAETAGAIWDRLTQVKETKGRLGILATRRALYRASAEESFEMVEHIAKLRGLQAELALMENPVVDEDFAMVVITSLPDSWDSFTTSWMGSQGEKKVISTTDLIPLLLEEDRRRRTQNGNSANSLQARFRSGGSSQGGSSKTDRECFNCGKKGHMKKDCWAKGGGKEGKGPKGRGGNRSNQATGSGAADLNTTMALTYMARFGETDTPKLVWHLDSGTTSHICTHRDAFSNYTPLSNATIQGVGPTVAVVEGVGTVTLNFQIGKDIVMAHVIRNVLYVPGAPNCLLSLSRFDEGGGKVQFGGGECVLFRKDGRIIGRGRLVDRLYQLDARAVLVRERANLASTPKKSWDYLHRIFGHVGITTLERMHQQGVVIGLDVDQSSIPSPTCVHCIAAKLTRRPFPRKADHRSLIPGEGIHSDVWGPVKPQSIGRFSYYISFTDDATRFVRVYFLKGKDDAFARIAEYFALMKRKFGKAPSWIKFVNGTELVNDKSKSLCAAEGTELRTTAPSQNGVAERLNRTLLELAHAMFIAKSQPQYLWDEAIATAVYIRNRVLTTALPGKTPFEAYHGKKPDISHLREFGCDVWVLDESVGRSKLSARANKMVFVGYQEGSRAIRYYDPKMRNIKVSRNVTFNENDVVTMAEIPGLGLEEGSEGSAPNPSDSQTGKEDTHMDQQPPKSTSPIPKSPPTVPQNFGIPEDVLPTNLSTYQGPTLRQLNKDTDFKLYGNPQARKPAPRGEEIKRRARKLKTDREVKASSSRGEEDEEVDNDDIWYRVLYSRVTMEEVDDVDMPLPKNVKEALGGPEKREWVTAIENELAVLKKKDTWKLVDLPEGRDAIGNRWVFARKTDDQGRVIRYKARLVAQGFSQKPGIDFTLEDTFSPRHATRNPLCRYCSCCHPWAEAHPTRLHQCVPQRTSRHRSLHATTHRI